MPQCFNAAMLKCCNAAMLKCYNAAINHYIIVSIYHSAVDFSSTAEFCVLDKEMLQCYNAIIMFQYKETF
jgi:hypothetical protein